MGDVSIEAVLLGTGASNGVPMVGCTCRVCSSQDPKDNRTRPSVYLRTGNTHLLIDTPPEHRMQCLRHGINKLHAVLFTHHHADHVAGLDDLRRFNYLMRAPLTCCGTALTLDRLQKMFPYAFSSDYDDPHSRPQLRTRVVEEEPFDIGEAHIIPIRMLHGPMDVLGFRFGDFAYCTDCSEIPTSSMRLLKGVRILVLDGLRHDPHPAHFCLEQAVEVARQLDVEQAAFTHLTHQLGHAETNRTLPHNMTLAHDGQRFVL